MGVIGDGWRVDLDEVEGVVGARVFERGRTYARDGRVVKVTWEPGPLLLRGSVIGSGPVLYRTTAEFEGEGGRDLAFLGGDCTCPMALDCKHVAALVIAGAGGNRSRGAPPLLQAGPHHEPAARPRPVPRWEESLAALVRSPAAAGSTPLAIELSVRTSPARGSTPRLHARLVRPAARGGWANGGLSFGSLEPWQLRSADYRPDHVALAKELVAIQRAGQPPYSYSYARASADKSIDLTTCGAQLWGLLAEADRSGMRLVHAGGGDEVDHSSTGEVVVDVTRRDDGDLEVLPRLQIEGGDGRHLTPLLFLGAAGHGVVCGDGGPRFALVRLTRSAPPELQRMVTDGDRLHVPAGDVLRFAQQACPALQRVAPVVSSDGSFVAPVVGPPTLSLHVAFGAGHDVELAWEWAYEIDGEVRHVAVGPDVERSGFRDHAAEDAVLAGVDFGLAGFVVARLVDRAARPVPGAVRLTGLDAMGFVTGHLPSLLDGHGFSVRVEGEAPDYRDVGEALEIGVSTSAVGGDRDWFGLGVTVTVEGRAVPFAEVFLAIAAGEEVMLLEDGSHFSLLDPRLQALRKLIEEARGLVDSPASPLRISRYQVGLWDELVALGVVTRQAKAWAAQVERLRRLDTISDHVPPTSLLAELRPYQREGFSWLATLWELGLGGILADDMGLGKTLQALALISHVREQQVDGTGATDGAGASAGASDGDPERRPFLVVAPTSVVSGWRAEAGHFAPKLDVEVVGDTFARSGRAVGDVTGADVVVTTYTLLRLDAELYGSVPWAGVILDEAQNVKNHQSKTHRAVRQLDAPFKLALTGTPMENSVMELWSLLSITAPGLFPDPKQFGLLYAKPIEREGDADALARLRRRIRPLMKRRTKELVAADLPPKQEQLLEVDLHPRHRTIYDTHLQRERQRVLGLLGDFDRNRFTILKSITHLRQLSLHAGLVDPRHEGVPCAKLGALTEQLEDVVGGGHRALVFSQFTSFLAVIRSGLDRAGVASCYLDGRTRNRERVIERFRTGDDPVFLISLKAGGVGLNLTEADYCFLLDPWWNPATENQAVDRTHRIGQQRPVMVYRMVSRDTIEEKVVALAQRKQALFDGVVDDGDLFAGALTADDIHALFE